MVYGVEEAENSQPSGRAVLPQDPVSHPHRVIGSSRVHHRSRSCNDHSGIYWHYRSKAEPRFIRIASSPRQLVSSTRNGQPANGSSGRPSFDSSGRYVAFTSNATNLSSSATNGEYNIYRKDRESGAIYLASRGLNGSPANGSSQFPTICRSGRYIAFALTATNLIQGKAHVNGKYDQVYVNDTLTGQTILVSETKARDRRE